MKRKRFLAVACAAAMIASMTTGLAVNVSAADEKSDFAGEFSRMDGQSLR